METLTRSSCLSTDAQRGEARKETRELSVFSPDLPLIPCPHPQRQRLHHPRSHCGSLRAESTGPPAPASILTCCRCGPNSPAALTSSDGTPVCLALALSQHAPPLIHTTARLAFGNHASGHRVPCVEYSSFFPTEDNIQTSGTLAEPPGTQRPLWPLLPSLALFLQPLRPLSCPLLTCPLCLRTPQDGP